MEGFLINLSIQVWRPDRKVSSVEHQLVLQQYYPDTTSITQAPPVLPVRNSSILGYGTLGGRIVPAFGQLTTPAPPGGSGQSLML